MKKEFFGLLCGCTLLPAFLHAQTERPNIVIVLADDLGWGDVGFHGSEIKTPCLDALVGEGVELERFYTSPISTPTRAGLMTGRYPNRFGVRSAVIPPWREDGLDENEETMADMLARNGYKNRAIIGKWHLGHTKKVHYPMNRGFSHFYGHLNGAIDYFDLTREGELDWHNDWETCHDKGYSTELITKEAIRCIDAYEKEGPFMLYVAYNAPHTPLQAQEKDIKLYCDNFDSLTPKEQKKVTYSFVDLVPTLKELVGDHSRPKREYDGISILPVLNGKKSCIDRDFYLGHGAVVNKDYKLIRKGMKPGLDLKQDFLVEYKTDPYEKKNASIGNEKIVKALYQVAVKYDTITPCLPEVPYGKGRDGFKAPKEWKVVR